MKLKTHKTPQIYLYIQKEEEKHNVFYLKIGLILNTVSKPEVPP